MFPNASFNTCRPCRRAKARTRSAAISSFLLQAARVIPGLSVVSCPIRSSSSQTSVMHESRWERASLIQSLSGTTVRSCPSVSGKHAPQFLQKPPATAIVGCTVQGRSKIEKRLHIVVVPVARSAGLRSRQSLDVRRTGNGYPTPILVVQIEALIERGHRNAPARQAGVRERRGES